MKYTTKPRKKFNYTLNATIWHKVEVKTRSWIDLKQYTHILGYTKSSIPKNAIGMSYFGGQKPRPQPTI